MTMMTTVLRVAAPRLLTVKNHKALLHHVLDCVDDGARDVVVDLSNTTYMDSSGLSALIGLHRVLSSDLRGRLRVTGVNPDLRLLLQATRLDRTIEVVDTVAEPLTTADAWHAPDDWTVPE